jgi:hypothetical protein
MRKETGAKDRPNCLDLHPLPSFTFPGLLYNLLDALHVISQPLQKLSGH